MICFIDLDGVLADFVSGACRAHNRPDPYNDPKSHGVFDIEKLWGLTPEQFWEPIVADPDFWFNLQETPEAKGIVRAAMDTFGRDHCCVLTAPNMDDPHCVPGKNWWVGEHFPEFKKDKAKGWHTGNILFGSAKQFLAGPDRVLIDDRDRNIDDFQKWGGVGIRVPRLWNMEWREASNTLAIVQERIKAINGRSTTGR